jgi:hypothetical protein
VQALEASRPPAPHAAGAVGEAPAGPSTRQPPGRPRRRSLLARLARALLS